MQCFLLVTLSTIPPLAVPGYVQAVRQLGAGRDQALVWVQAATGEPGITQGHTCIVTLPTLLGLT